MAVLQKIRDRNILLVSIVAIALLLFVIQGVFSGNFLFGSNSQTAGTVNGEELSIQDYQQLVQDYQNFFEITQPGQDMKSEEASNRVRDIAWQNYVMNTIIESECEKVGLAVTDEEVQTILRTGESQLLQSPLFRNQETGQYDPTVIPMFLNQYDEVKKSGQPVNEQFEKTYKYIIFIEKLVKQEALQNKYQSLLAFSLISNPIEAKRSYDGRTLTKNIQVAYFPYSKISDSTIKISDEEINARFEKDKAKYFSLYAIRDGKLISVQVKPSPSDRKDIESDFNNYFAELDSVANQDLNMVIRNSGSDIPYSDLFKSESGYPTHIRKLLTATDSSTLTIGQTSKPKYDPISNSYYIAKLIDKTEEADSVSYREIGVIGEDSKKNEVSADSILDALNKGEKFDSLAIKYSQPTDTAWISTAQYENERITNADALLHIQTLYKEEVGFHKLKLTNGNFVVIQIIEKKKPITKYKVAVIEKPFIFSDKTYNEEYNKFSKFISSYKTMSELEANASKNGYTVKDIAVQSNDHLIDNIRGTQDALRWLFDEAEIGEISQIYRCGTNDNFMVLSLQNINKGTMSERIVKEMIRTEIMNEKKAEQIMQRLSKVTNMESAKAIDGVEFQDSVSTTAQMPAFIGTAQEPLVSMKAYATPKGGFCRPFKGNAGIYMLQVISEERSEEKFDLFKECRQVQGINVRRTMQTLLGNTFMKLAKVEDFRYKFNM